MGGIPHLRDALSSDALALIAHLDLGDYDLGGYSLGGRVVARVLTLSAAPRRGFIGGTGLEPIIHATGRGENYRRIFSNPGRFAAGSSEARLEGFVKQIGADPVALIRVLDTFVDTSRRALAQVEVPTVVIAGEQDSGRGSVEDLAALLPRGCLHKVPGDHFSALTSPELVDHLARFLGDQAAS
jgi:pimeloyl-ACP methyl ester carboxylesterase